MGGDQLMIFTENHKTSYYPGQTVRGMCQLELDNPLKIKEIVMKFKGKAHCHWTEGSGENTRYYSANEKYFDVKQVVYGKEQTQQDSVELPSGHHSYPFSFEIPTEEELPPSFEGLGGYVRYFLAGHVVIPWGRNKKSKLVINLMSQLDLNSITTENLMSPSEMKGTKTICCLCCESNPITGFVTTERKGYVPGDTVVFNAEVVNGSRRNMKKVKGQLIMNVTYRAFGKTHVYTNKLEKINHGSLAKGGSDIFRNERLRIPPVPPSYLRGCKIIDVNYYVQIVVVPAGPALNLRVNAEIVVGSIPLATVASQNGVTIPSAPSVPGSDLTPSTLYNETTFSAIPQASVAESVFGDLGKKKKDKEPAVSTNFVPSYTFYKWNQQDPADMFTVKS